MNSMKNGNKYLILWGLLIAALISLLTTLGFAYKKKTDVYKKLEATLVEASKKYVDAKFLYPQDDRILKVTSDVLLSENQIETMSVDNQECTGYVNVFRDGTIFNYKAFIKCDRYTTKGYEK